jgi:septal ring factor EnvC (AmiA/AmiB activator)
VQNSPSPESSILPVNSTDGDDYDYDELAASLLVKVVDVLSGKGSSDANSSWPQRRLLAFERRYSQLERDLTAANAQIRKISEERDQLRRRLEQAEQNISILQDGIATSRPQVSGAMARLKLEDRALLTQLRNPSTVGLGDRVGAASSAE